MADPPGRALALVSTAHTTTTAQAAFAQAVQEVLQTHQDIAAEDTWQALARLITQHWLLLNTDQPPVATWGMLTRCSETVLKLRRAQKQGDRSGADAIEEFRRFMGDVLGQGTEE